MNDIIRTTNTFFIFLYNITITFFIGLTSVLGLNFFLVQNRFWDAFGGFVCLPQQKNGGFVNIRKSNIFTYKLMGAKLSPVRLPAGVGVRPHKVGKKYERF